MVKVIRKAKIDINLGATHGILQVDKSPSGTCLVTYTKLYTPLDYGAILHSRRNTHTLAKPVLSLQAN